MVERRPRRRQFFSGAAGSPRCVRNRSGDSGKHRKTLRIFESSAEVIHGVDHPRRTVAVGEENIVSESSDEAQASIMFMGRESFRMEVVGRPAYAGDAEAIPSAAWEQTQRIIERRRAADRRRPPRVEHGTAEPLPAPAKNSIIAVSLIFFVGGALVATAVDRLRHHAVARSAAVAKVAQAPNIQPPAVARSASPPPAQTAVIIQPLPKTEAEPLPAAAATVEPAPAVDSAPPALEHQEKRAPIAKAAAA